MCIAAIAFKMNPKYPLVCVANRDEFYERPTELLHKWPTNFAAGKDLKSGGTWQGFCPNGRWSIVTNFREITPPPKNALSRGLLVTSFLMGDLPPSEFIKTRQLDGNAYAGFNLLVGDSRSLWYWSNRAPSPQELSSGLYLLSNGLLEEPWFKVRKLRKEITTLIQHNDFSSNSWLAAMQDTTPAPSDEVLPNTGFSLELEKQLTPIFIATEKYGTRTTTFSCQFGDGHTEIIEQTHFPNKEVRQVKLLREN